MTLPGQSKPSCTVADLDVDYVQSVLRANSANSGLCVASVKRSRLGKGTSAASLALVEVAVTTLDQPLRLVLKVNPPGAANEARVYKELRHLLPVSTPEPVDVRTCSDGSSWLLLSESANATDSMHWTRDHLRGVVCEMAVLHAAFWGGESLDGFEWLSRPDSGDYERVAETLRTQLCRIEALDFHRAIPGVLPPDRIRLIHEVLDEWPEVVAASVAVGYSLVHGDCWFHNVLVVPDGRPVFVDWGDCRIGSPFWELVYFVDLLHVASPRRFRKSIPASAHEIVSWYLDALSTHGILLDPAVVHRTIAANHIVHTLTHWLPRIDSTAIGAGRFRAWKSLMKWPPLASAVASTVAPRGAIRHLEVAFARCERHATALLSGTSAWPPL